MTAPERFRHGLPTDAGLRRIRRRLLVVLGVGLGVAVVLWPASNLGPVALVVAGFVIVLGAGLAVGDATPGTLAKREILTAGSRRRRRRLRFAVLRRRADALDDDDLRVCHHLVPVVHARARVLLLVNATSLLGTMLMVGGFWLVSRAPGWLLVLAPVVLVVALSELALRAVEARVASRFMTSQGG